MVFAQDRIRSCDTVSCDKEVMTMALPAPHRIVPLLALLAAIPAFGQTPPGEDNFYSRSLHFTNRGIEFVYAKENGGLERLTGMSAEKLGCLKASCHVTSCDTCHRREVDGKVSYSVEQARSGEACARCHDADPKDPDVHRQAGMKCMACHTSREVHGDGVAHDTYQQPGVIETRCEKCHAAIAKTASHTVHKGKLDCGVCHVRDVPTCFNCHLESRMAKKKSSSIERHGLFFLVNHDGRVTLANFLSYVYKNGTMITLAPTSPHSITRAGRRCPDCHGTSNVRAVAAGTLVLSRFSAGELKTAEGVIPVVDGMKWNLVFLDRDGDRWVPLANPAPPLVNFSGLAAPLTRAQLASLEHAHGGPR
jgi:hypothetical protein